MKKLFLAGILLVAAAGWWFTQDFLSVDRKDALVGEVAQEKMFETTNFPEAKDIPQETREVEKSVVSVQKSFEKVPEKSLIEDVPFTVQAPFAEWSDPLFQNACEEASLVMAAHWLSGKPLAKEIAKQEILDLSHFEKKWLWHSVDTSAEDTLKLFQDYYGYTVGEVRSDIELVDIREALVNGKLVIVPADGRKLKNPHFTQPGPPRHMLVIIGYDTSTREFITNDPGTKHGEGYRYPEDVLYGAILDYPTGDHLPVKSARRVMIVIGKS